MLLGRWITGKRGAALASGYDAFIAYSHRHDGLLAPALQRGLERFAKPWYRPRALRVFCDTANLAASPALWASIEEALSASRWFVLLASEDSARSPWVNREVAWWLAHRSPNRLLIVATSPGLSWDERAADWAADAPVSPVLRGVLDAEPLWADLSGMRPGSHGAHIPDEQLATVAAALRGEQRDALIGEHLREHRRAMRLARGAIAVLATLTALAVAVTVIAVGQRDAARTQARIAAARQIAALSVSLLGTHLDVAQLLAVAAYRMDSNAQSRSALLQAVAASPYLVRYLQAGAPVTALACSANGKIVIAGTAGGRLVSGSSPAAVAVSPSGRLTAVLDAANMSSASVLIRDTADGSERRARVSRLFKRIAFPAESSLALVADGGQWQRMNPGSLQTTASSFAMTTPAGDFTVGISPDGGYSAYVKYGEVIASRTAGSAGAADRFLSGTVPDAPASALSISPDGTHAAVVQSGTIYVTALSAGLPQPGEAAVPLVGDGDSAVATFLGDSSSQLISTAGSSLALWDTEQTSRLSQPTGVAIPFASNAAPPPTLLSSPDGSWLSVVGGNGTGARLFRTGRKLALAAAPSGNWYLPMHRGDEPLLLGGTGTDLILADSTGRTLRSWPDPGGGESPVAAAMLPGTNQFAVVGADGSVRVYDTSSGAVRQVARGTSSFVPAAEAAISPDGRAAVMSQWTESLSSFGSVRVVYVDLRTGAAHLVGTGGADGVLFTPHGLLIQRSTGTLEVWDSAGRTLQQTLPGAGGTARPLAVSPDGTLVARLRDDGGASVTDLETGNVLATFGLPGLTSPDATAADPWDATAMMFTPDGRDLLTATSGGDLTRWTMNEPDLVREACATAGRSLTAAQWRQYVHTDPPADLSCTA